MSYSRSYSRTIAVHYSDSFTDSEGHSHRVSGTVYEPVNITIHVDTGDFDGEISSCKAHIGGLTASVVATEAAEVATKRESSDKIAGTIIKGFFDYVNKDLEQQIVALDSKCNSKLIELVEQKDACLKKKEQMSQDYNRISKNYSKLFNDLDTELSNRLINLDKPTFNISKEIENTVKRTIENDILGLGAIAVAETTALSNVLASSAIKKRTKETIASVNDYLNGIYYLNSSINSILTNSDDYGEQYIPVIYVENSSEINPANHEIFGIENIALKSSKSASNTLLNEFQKPSNKWQTLDENGKKEIDTYLNNEIQNSNLDPRVVKMMMKLKEGSEIKENKI